MLRLINLYRISLGYGGLAMLEALEEMYGKEQDIFQYFDLFAGASIGGLAALLHSRMVTL